MKRKNLERLLRKSTYAIMLTIALLLGSCKSKQIVTEVPVKTETRVIEKLIPVVQPIDSANLLARLECDSTNHVLMTLLDKKNSKNLTSDLSFQNGLLSYNIKTIRDTVFLHAKDSIVYQDKLIEVPTPVVTNELNWWQKLFVWSGVVLWSIIIIWFLIKLIKNNLKL